MASSCADHQPTTSEGSSGPKQSLGGLLTSLGLNSSGGIKATPTAAAAAAATPVPSADDQEPGQQNLGSPVSSITPAQEPAVTLASFPNSQQPQQQQQQSGQEGAVNDALPRGQQASSDLTTPISTNDTLQESKETITQGNTHFARRSLSISTSDSSNNNLGLGHAVPRSPPSQPHPAAGAPISPLNSAKGGSRFSVHLAGMTTQLGLTQANGERAVDMAHDLKKNVYSMWSNLFPSDGGNASTPTSSSSSSTPVPPVESFSTATTEGSGATALDSSIPAATSLPGPTLSSSTLSLASTSSTPPPPLPRSTSATPPRGVSSNNSSPGSVKKPGQDSQKNNNSNNTNHSIRRSADSHNNNNTLSAQQLLQQQQLQAENSLSSSQVLASAPPVSDKPIFMMGKEYPPLTSHQWADFVKDFSTSLIWCTYRHSYAPIKPATFTTDVGWGCMLRSGQSLLANVLAIQFMGRDWTKPRRGDPYWDIYTRILIWFLDDMNPKSPFSVHRIALLGKQMGKNIGEWFGPSTTSQVIKALVHNFPESGLGVYVTQDGVIYKDQVESAATLNKKAGFGNLLILVTVRLGIDKLNPIYIESLKSTFELRQSMGIAGGRPSSSYYFVGYQGNDLYYLDPHHSRAVIDSKDLADYTEEDLATYHCDTVRKIDVHSIDPSMLLAFFCRDRQDFDDLCNSVEKNRKRVGNFTPIFSIGETAPDYGDDLDDGKLLSVADDEDEDLELVL